MWPARAPAGGCARGSRARARLRSAPSSRRCARPAGWSDRTRPGRCRPCPRCRCPAAPPAACSGRRRRTGSAARRSRAPGPARAPGPRPCRPRRRAWRPDRRRPGARDPLRRRGRPRVRCASRAHVGRSRLAEQPREGADPVRTHGAWVVSGRSPDGKTGAALIDVYVNVNVNRIRRKKGRLSAPSRPPDRCAGRWRVTCTAPAAATGRSAGTVEQDDGDDLDAHERQHAGEDLVQRHVRRLTPLR
jgi:hypothetical protein